MKKYMKKASQLMMIMLLIMSFAVVSFGTVYSSTLYIPGNSTLEGSWRDYDAGTMKISIKFSSLLEPTSSNPMQVVLQKKKLLGYDSLGSSDKNYPRNTYVTTNFNTQANGTYRFYFSTFGYYSSGGTADYVQMGNF